MVGVGLGESPPTWLGRVGEWVGGSWGITRRVGLGGGLGSGGGGGGLVEEVGNWLLTECWY